MPVPFFSVVIPTYNRRTVLARAIASVHQQTATDYEVIVVDDASTDGTMAWLAQTYPHIQAIALPTNRGAAGARNAGILAARGEWIAFLDSDDEWLPDYLAQQRQALMAHPQVSFSAGTGQTASYQQPDQWTVVESRPWPIYASATEHMLMSPMILTMSVVVARRQALLQVGLLNESLRLAEDRELYLRLLQVADYVYVPQAIARRRQGADSLTQNMRLYAQAVMRVVDLFLATPGGAAYRPQRGQAKSRWALTIAHRLLQQRTDFTLALALGLQAMYFDPGLVWRGLERRLRSR